MANTAKMMTNITPIAASGFLRATRGSEMAAVDRVEILQS